MRGAGILEEVSSLHGCSGSLGLACIDRSGLERYEADGQQREATRWNQLDPILWAHTHNPHWPGPSEMPILSLCSLPHFWPWLLYIISGVKWPTLKCKFSTQLLSCVSLDNWLHYLLPVSLSVKSVITAPSSQPGRKVNLMCAWDETQGKALTTNSPGLTLAAQPLRPISRQPNTLPLPAQQWKKSSKDEALRTASLNRLRRADCSYS